MTIFTTDRIKKGRTVLLLDHPFFGALIFRLKLVATPRIKTMATDGASLFYNPGFVDSLTPSQLVGCLAHEVDRPHLLLFQFRLFSTGTKVAGHSSRQQSPIY